MIRASVPLLAAACLLAACASSPATRYHGLTPVPAADSVPVHYAGLPIEVRGVQLPASFDRLELVRQISPGQYAVLDFDHWAAPLDRLTRQALTTDLVSRLGTDRVVLPGSSWPARRAALNIDILSFDEQAGTATMVIGWALTGEGVTPTGATLRLSSPVSADASGTADAWSSLLGQAADRIKASLAP